MNNIYHIPVLLQESIDGLNILPNGVYVDATFGGGGHTKEILNNLNSSGKVIAFDQDVDAIENQIDDNRLKLIKSNFKYLSNHLKFLKINKIDGLLADFGVSSYQIDTQIRGFSIRFDSDLDMRMNKNQKKDAKQVLNKYGSDDATKALAGKIWVNMPFNLFHDAHKLMIENGIPNGRKFGKKFENVVNGEERHKYRFDSYKNRQGKTSYNFEVDTKAGLITGWKNLEDN